MYPIIACSVFTLAIGAERAFYYIRTADRKDFLKEVRALISKKEFDRARSLSADARGPLAAVIAEALLKRELGVPAVGEAISFRGSLELKGMSRNLHVLELIGRVAPLMGLLGTVLGMVAAFMAVSASRGQVEPSMLAGGIWEALITTVAGLSVAIPALVLHHFFEDRVKETAYRIRHHGAELMEILKESDDRA